MGRDYLTIGEVVDRLSGRYPDLSISKVRFLEEEGLIAPQRTAGGYRKFDTADVERIEAILKLQRDYFLPLAVIRDKLTEMDHGRVPEELRGAGDIPGMSGRVSDGEAVALTGAASALGMPDGFLRELIDFGLVTTQNGAEGQEITPSGVRIARLAWDLRRYGIEPRHLRMYANGADREAALFGQVLTPAYRHKDAESRAGLAEALSDISKATGELKAELLERALEGTFDGML
jgi:DNA-binding transcriptional MerR regulator